MGTVVEINGDVITVKFKDGSSRKFLRENFIKEPYLNQNVEINSDGTIIDFDEKKHKKKKRENTVLYVVVIPYILFFILFTFTMFYIVDCAKTAGNAVSCIRDCD